jgi:hypothetical protein
VGWQPENILEGQKMRAVNGRAGDSRASRASRAPCGDGEETSNHFWAGDLLLGHPSSCSSERSGGRIAFRVTRSLVSAD